MQRPPNPVNFESWLCSHALGSVIYVIPFIFVLDVAFILQVPWHQSLQAFATIVGAWFMCWTPRLLSRLSSLATEPHTDSIGLPSHCRN